MKKLLAYLTFAAMTSGTFAYDQFFTVANGDWHTAGNWSPANIPERPSGTSHLFVGGNRTVHVNAGTANVWVTHVGAQGGAGTINMHAGTNMDTQYIRLGRNAFGGIGDGNFIMDGNDITIQTEFSLAWSAGAANHTFQHNSGTVNTPGGTFALEVGEQDGGSQSTYNLTGGTYNARGTHTVIGQGGRGNLNVSGGLFDANEFWGGNGNAAALSTINVTGGILHANNSYLGVRAVTDVNVSGGLHDSDVIHMGHPSVGASSTLDVTGTGVVNVGTLNISSGPGTANFTHEGGTLQVNTINENQGAGGTFTWNNGTITPRTVGAAVTGGSDVSSPGFNDVIRGTSIAFNGDLATGATGGTSTLDLNSLYINSGVRFDQLAVSGALDLSVAGDELAMQINPYLLRPNIGTAVESGEIPLVTAASITDEFDIGPTFLQDNIGWSEYTGAWTVGVSDAATTLGINEYFLEYDSAGSITLFYKVEGTVPEPGTLGLLLLGVIGIRTARQR